MKQNVEIVEYISHIPNISSDMEFVKCFTPVRFPKISILPEKRINRDIFGEKFRIKDAFFIYFEQIVSLFADFYSNAK